MKNILLLVSGILVRAPVSAFMASYRVRVIDGENDDPIKDVEVYGGFVMGSRGWDNTPPANVDTRLTGSDGMCRLRGNTDEGESYFGMSKRGYYKSERGGYAVGLECRRVGGGRLDDFARRAGGRQCGDVLGCALVRFGCDLRAYRPRGHVRSWLCSCQGRIGDWSSNQWKWQLGADP